jgi:hypothetical protein
METHPSIEKIKIELRKLPDTVRSNRASVEMFLEKLIDLGTELDQLFTLGYGEPPSYQLQEDLIAAYNLWSLGAGRTLLLSDFGVKNKLRIKYPTLIENDGVEGIILPLMHPDKFQDLSVSQNLRFAEVKKGENFVRPSKEGIKQFKNAHIYLKKKIIALSEIFQEEPTKQKTYAQPKASTTSTSLTFYFDQNTGELARYPRDKNHVCSFQINDGKYKIMVALIQEKIEGDDHYIPTHELKIIGNYKGNQQCRLTMIKIRKDIEDTFNTISGMEFIENKPKEGYRIGKKFEVFFENIS